MDKEFAEIERNLLEVMWYMRGGISLKEAYDLTFDQRSHIVALIKENAEISKKTGRPIY